MNKKEFGDLVRKRRKELKLTQPQLAKIAGISQGSISRIENATQKNLKEDTKEPLLKALKITDTTILKSKVDELLYKELADLDHEDKITILRVIIRLKSDSKKAASIIRRLVESTE